jgi:virginiamycin B lyase
MTVPHAATRASGGGWSPADPIKSPKIAAFVLDYRGGQGKHPAEPEQDRQEEAMPKTIAASLLAATAFALIPLAAQAQQKPPALPDGAGKDVVERVCTSCHQTNMITASSGYTRDGWKEIAATMINLSGTPQEEGAILNYLSTQFPPNTRRAPKLMPGSAQVTFKEWVPPTLGQRSRDPAPGPDGAIWFVGQWSDLVGRIDPKTGEVKEFPLPPKSKPHTVLLDAKGGVWYMGNGNATIGKVDPSTGKVVATYKMPDPNAKDPHSAIFDSKGILWFTMQNSNRVGRLDPSTGDIKIAVMPTPNSKPYGIKVDAQGTPWVACNGAPCLVKIDPATMQLTEVKLPTPGTTVRRLAFDAEGNVWFVNSSQGKLGRLNPKTGEIKEWASPSGPKSHPYAIAVIDGAVWYNESAMRPDTLVRFDPKTEQFQSWAIPSGKVHAGIIRHMRVTRDGNLLIHQSSTNRIIQVTIGRKAAAK